ncbi:EamA family transporter [Cryptosporangium aurantiacum]|uniref:Threonine/homoserine efflux transporter RhtA n=1 Tax=Cryptosporangium aurantiacum TaxID=134849 RepID=A0A1M7RDX5_9ACTN|nr:EamA family transporter [Cryptosporangium aurantiacum]SHN44372.1 Threonine/homoserine efflux transporter RhtA [Cryptosporangium aurantiacum]
MSVTRIASYAGQRRGAVGLGLALISATAFGTSGSFGDALMSSGWTSGAVVTTRISLAALILTVPALWQLRGRWRALRSSFGVVALYGAVAVAGCQLFFFNAVQRLDVGVALLLEYMGIVLVVLWMWVRHRRRPRWLTLLGVAAAIGGLVLVLDPSGGLDAVGVIWGLLAGTGLAVYFVLSARQDDAVPPLVVAWGGMVVGSLTLGAFALVGALPVHAASSDVELFGQRMSWLVPVLGLSVVAAAIAYTAGVGAARLLGATVASFVGLTEVLFAVLFAALSVGQVPGVTQLIGGLVVLVGVALVRATEGAADDAPPVVDDVTPTKIAA